MPPGLVCEQRAVLQAAAEPIWLKRGIIIQAFFCCWVAQTAAVLGGFGPVVYAAQPGTRTEQSRISPGWRCVSQHKVSDNRFLQHGALAGNNPAAGAGSWRNVGWRGRLEGISQTVVERDGSRVRLGAQGTEGNAACSCSCSLPSLWVWGHKKLAALLCWISRV